MKTKIKYYSILFLLVPLLTACVKPFLVELDSSAGFNGSFEKIKHGLPINWHIYTPEEYQKSYKLIFDTVDAKEGKQSLKFEIQKTDSVKFIKE